MQHGNTNIRAKFTQIRQHINTNIRAKVKQIMINQCLEICLQPFVLLWVALRGITILSMKFEILH